MHNIEKKSPSDRVLRAGITSEEKQNYIAKWKVTGLSKKKFSNQNGLKGFFSATDGQGQLCIEAYYESKAIHLLADGF